MAAGDVAFGTLNLNDGTTYKVSGELPIHAGGPDAQRMALAVREGSFVEQRRYPEKTVTIPGVVKGASAAACESNADALVLALGNGVQNLKAGWQDERYYLAQLLGEVTLKRPPGHAFYLPFEATFLLADPFGYAATASQLVSGTALSIVAGSLYRKTVTPTVGGSIYCWPIYTIGVHSGGSSPWGITTITVRNQATGEEISISRTFATSDALVINCADQSVQVNGVDVDYYGSFPSLDPRAGATNSVQLDAIGTSAPTLDLTIDWTKRYA